MGFLKSLKKGVKRSIKDYKESQKPENLLKREKEKISLERKRLEADRISLAREKVAKQKLKLQEEKGGLKGMAAPFGKSYYENMPNNSFDMGLKMKKGKKKKYY